VAKQLEKLYTPKRIKILHRAGKLGLGSAYIDGLKLVSGDFVFIMDADLSHHVRGGRWLGGGVGALLCLPPLLFRHAAEST